MKKEKAATVEEGELDRENELREIYAYTRNKKWTRIYCLREIETLSTILQHSRQNCSFMGIIINLDNL